jgi:hypothetical protein
MTDPKPEPSEPIQSTLRDRYTKRWHDEEKTDAVCCDSCAYEAPLAEFRRAPRFGQEHAEETKLLCRLCAGSWSGKAIDYPRQYPDAYTMQVVCNVGNAILEKLDDIAAAIREEPTDDPA